MSLRERIDNRAKVEHEIMQQRNKIQKRNRDPGKFKAEFFEICDFISTQAIFIVAIVVIIAAALLPFGLFCKVYQQLNVSFCVAL